MRGIVCCYNGNRRDYLYMVAGCGIICDNRGAGNCQPCRDYNLHSNRDNRWLQWYSDKDCYSERVTGH